MKYIQFYKSSDLFSLIIILYYNIIFASELLENLGRNDSSLLRSERVTTIL